MELFLVTPLIFSRCKFSIWIWNQLQNGFMDEMSGIVLVYSFACRILIYQTQVLGLTEKLHGVTSKFDQLRAARFRDVISRSAPRRKRKPITTKSDFVKNSKLDNEGEFREQDQSQPEPLRVHQQLLDDETRALQVISRHWDQFVSCDVNLLRSAQELSNPVDLQVELTSLLDAVQQTETKMVEMSALNHLMATHVLHQAQQIEQLYDQVRCSNYLRVVIFLLLYA